MGSLRGLRTLQYNSFYCPLFLYKPSPIPINPFLFPFLHTLSPYCPLFWTQIFNQPFSNISPMNPLYPLSTSFMEKHEEKEDPNLKLYIFSSSQAASAAASSSSQLPNFATCFNQTEKNLHHLHHHHDQAIPTSIISSSF